MTKAELTEAPAGYPDDVQVKTLCGELAIDIQSVSFIAEEGKDRITVLIW